MKRFIFLSLLLLATPVLAQSTAQQVQLGFLSTDTLICGTRPKPCFTPYSDTHPMPISGGGGGGSPGGSVNSFQYNLDGSSFGGQGPTASSVPAWDGSSTPISLGYSTTATASNLVERDSNANIFSNNFLGNGTSTVSAGGTTILTSASPRYQALTGSSSQTYQLPDATTLSLGPWFVFNNNSSGSLTITNAGGSTIYTVPAGGIEQCGPTNIDSSNGSWDCHGYLPSTVTWGTGTSGLIFNTALSTTPQIMAGASSCTSPTFIPQRTASTTGFGGAGTNICGAVGGTTAFTATASTFTAPTFTASGTGADQLPVGTTGQRPTAAQGQIRFNSTTPAIEFPSFVSGAIWATIGMNGTTTNGSGTYTSYPWAERSSTFVGVNAGPTANETTTCSGDNTGIGHRALYALGTSQQCYYANNLFTAGGNCTQNVAIGSTTLSALDCTSATADAFSGSANTAIGFSIMKNLNPAAGAINADRNIGIGENALNSLSTGYFNTFICTDCGSTGTGSGMHDSTIVGGQSGLKTAGSFDTIVGSQAYNNNTTGNANAALGAYTLYSNTTGSNNVAIGGLALFANTTGINNIALGYKAGSATLSTGGYNVLIGSSDATGTPVNTDTQAAGTNFAVAVGDGVVPGTNDVAIGYQALNVNATAGNNVAVGYTALAKNTTGNALVAVGYQALNANTTGVNNVAVGNGALAANTTGVRNVAVGQAALAVNSTGVSNTALGHTAGSNNTTATQNTFVGAFSGQFPNTGGSNTFVGYTAGQGITGSKLSGSNNTAIGTASGALLQGAAGTNTAVGSGSLDVATTGSSNTAIGYQALHTTTTGTNNTAVGYQVGSTTLTTGTNNLLLGTSNTTTTSGAAVSNEIHIGAGGSDIISTTGAGTNTTAITTMNGFTVYPQQQTRVSSDVSKNNDASFTAITGLTATLAAGNTYAFTLYLHTTSGSSGGVQIDLNGGSATATNIIADGVATAGPGGVNQNQITSLASSVLCANTAVTSEFCQIYGTITVNAGGTFIPRYAQNVSNGTNTVIKRGSVMFIQQLN